MWLESFANASLQETVRAGVAVLAAACLACSPSAGLAAVVGVAAAAGFAVFAGFAVAGAGACAGGLPSSGPGKRSWTGACANAASGSVQLTNNAAMRSAKFFIVRILRGRSRVADEIYAITTC